MIRHHVVFWLAVCAMGFATYKVKYGVQDLAENVVRVQQQTVGATEKIRDLRAEWAYLTQPRRLARLNADLLQLQPITTPQLMAQITDIPFRPPPVPSGAPVAVASDAGVGGSLAQAASGLAATPARFIRPELVAAATPAPAAMRLARAEPSLDALFAEVAGTR